MTTRSARAALAEGVHWRRLDPEVHLGYRRGKRGGRWLVRWRSGTSYKQAGLGTANDVIGEGTLNFEAAVVAARKQVEAARAAEKARADGPALTVRVAVDEYVAMYHARLRSRIGRQSGRSGAHSQFNRHVLQDKIADTPVYELSRDKLRAWRKRIADKDISIATVRRICNDFRVALNAAAETHHVRLPPALPFEIKSGLAATERDYNRVSREAQVLTDAEVRQVVAAALRVDAEGNWDGDLARLVLVLAATGARFSQVVRMTVADVQAVQMRLMVPTSHKGRGEKTAKTGVPVGEDVMGALLPAKAGRIGSAVFLERWRHTQTSPVTWIRVGRAPWRNATEMSRPWRRIIQIAGLPSDVVPYALRHSSIVRGLREMLPLRLVAALHDTSSAMIEKHYSAFIVSALDDLAARAVVPLNTSGADSILPAVAGLGESGQLACPTSVVRFDC